MKIWKVSSSTMAGSFGSYVLQTTINNGVYAAGELIKTATVDEHGKQVIEFKDKEGKVILKKVQLTATADDGAGKNNDGWLCTYYLYDDLNNLRCVIQPEGVKALPGNGWALTTTLLAEQCFRYEYDARNRMSIKKVPGAAPVSLVYDKRDRLVLTQDGNLAAAGKWMVTIYDELNRPVQTGLWANSGSWAAHSSAAASASSYYYPFNESSLPASGYELLTKTHYDNYNGLPSGLSDYLTTWNSYFSNTDNINWPYPQMPVKSIATKGMAIWTQTKVLGTASTFINAVSYYDEKGRVIQVQSTNITGGTDVVTTQYSWAGQPLVTVAKQEKTGTNAQTTVAVTKLTYDDLGRLVKTEKKLSNTSVNSNAMSSYKTIAENEYNKLGQLKKKKVGTNPSSGNALETQNYEYNIRGWMLGMNRDYARDANSTNYFGFDLGYDKQNNNLIGSQNYLSAQYNGNITGMLWKSKGDGEKRKYDFAYDAANRLLKADFTQYTSGSFNQSAGVNFNMKMGDGSLLPDGSLDPNTAYDYNGNIRRMQQWGLKITGSTQIDNLVYTYQPGSNKLARVTDTYSDAQTKLGDFKDGSNSGDDYAYDVNGNLVLDWNKNLIGLELSPDGQRGIKYNHLNLPVSAEIMNKGSITYIYDAAGNKLKKVVNDMNTIDNATTTTLYIGGAVYEDDVLKFIGMEDGRIRPATVNGQLKMVYDYMLKDHLGNVRMVITDEQKTDAYPAASMETAQATTEQNFYSNIPETKYAKASISGYPADNYTNPNDYVAKVRGDGQKIGPAIILKVMAGDKFNLQATSWYKMNGATPGNPANPLNDLLAALAGGIGNISGGHGGATAAEITSSGVLSPGATQFLNERIYNSSKPKAYVNWILLDEQFKYVAGNSGAQQVGMENTLTVNEHMLSGKPIDKSGYLYIYVSNETPNIDVFFDNLQVTHIRGQILEETHYYSFGLTMAGISSKALAFGGAENKRKFNGIEHTTDFDLNMYDAFYRGLDPQIGRWWQIDPKPTDWESPYAAMKNNPIFKFDTFGDTVYNANAADDATILKWIGQNLNLKKGQTNPFSFTKAGILKMNQKAYNKLSKEQKEVGQNVVDAINSKDLLEVQLVDNAQVLETETIKLGKNEVTVIIGGKSYKDGDVVDKTIENWGGGRVMPPEINGNGEGSNYIVAQISRQSITSTVQSTNGVGVSNPNSVVLGHEAFGHFVYHYIQNSNTQNKQTIEYENKIRALRNLPLRSGSDHPKDKP